MNDSHSTSALPALTAPDGTATDPLEAERLLRIYLQDHHAGSVAGVSLIKRSRGSNEGTALADLLAEIEAEVVQDQRSLEIIMAHLGMRPSLVKGAVGAVSERVGRLKTNGKIAKYSPSSRVLELEGIAAGVLTKLNLWRTLQAVSPDGSRFGPVDIHQLARRAERQLERLQSAHHAAAITAFGEINHLVATTAPGSRSAP
jgi:hypothetical protein